MSEEDTKVQEAEAADLQKRVEAFNAKLIPLLGEFELGLGATPFITNDGRIFARPNLFNDKKKPEVADAPAAAQVPAEAPASDTGLASA